MLCPYCQNKETKVVDKRNNEETIRRRRECLKCERRWTTYEKPETIDLFIIKTSGIKENFNKEKLKKSFTKAANKTSITEKQIDNYINKIENKLRKQGTLNIQSKIIGDEVIKILKKADHVAYLRYASVYKEFTDKKDFRREIKNLT